MAPQSPDLSILTFLYCFTKIIIYETQYQHVAELRVAIYLTFQNLHFFLKLLEDLRKVCHFRIQENGNHFESHLKFLFAFS